MEKSDYLKLFLRKEVAAASAEFMYKAMSALQIEKKEETIRQFVSDIKEIRKVETIRFLQISLTYHKALMGKPFYGLLGFGPSLYLAPPVLERELDWGWMYNPYYDFCERISIESKKYVMQITKKDLETIFMLELDETKHIVRQLFEETAADLIQSKELCEFGVKTGLQIQLSDYMGPYEELCTFDNQSEQLGGLMNGIL